MVQIERVAGEEEDLALGIVVVVDVVVTCWTRIYQEGQHVDGVRPWLLSHAIEEW